MLRRRAFVRVVRAVSGAAILAAASVPACRGEPSPATVAVALGPVRAELAPLARTALDRQAQAGAAVRITIDSIDRYGTADEVARARWALDQPGVAVVVGHSNSRATRAAAPLYAERGVPLVAPTSTSRLLRDLPGVFLLAPDDSAEGAYIARYAHERLGARSALVFYHLDEYGQGLRTGVAAELARRGVAILQEVGYHPTSPFEPLVEAAFAQGRPDVMVVAGRALDTGRLARLAWARAPGLRVMAGDGAMAPARLAEEAGAALDSIYVAAFWHPARDDAASREFVERYRRSTGREPDAERAMGYDAIMVAAEAVRRAGPDPAAVARWLASLGRERPPYPGVTGPVAFGVDRSGLLVMLRVRGGRAVPAADAGR
jgi:branched-chain amino acid transport system substrate-binding protein